jgi:Uma2 family endonuclease
MVAESAIWVDSVRDAELPPLAPSPYLMAMPITLPRYAIQDLESFPDDGNRYELLDGVLLVTPAPGPSHQAVLARLVSELNVYLYPQRDVIVFSPGVVESEPRHHLEPDLLVVPSVSVPRGLHPEARWSSILEWWLAVEVSGEGSEIYDRDYKGPAYLALGVREFWRVDLRDRCVYVSRSGGPTEQAHADAVAWLPPPRSEALVISVPELFR